MSQKSVNEFVIRFANINGTGSASANSLFARAIGRMGIPVGPKNIFPSNIQGMPTWYEVRVSEKGYIGRRGTVDFVVGMNPQSMKQDIESVLSGGYFLYDCSRPLPESWKRNDIEFIGIPFTETVNREFTDPRQRLLLKNIMYVGALSALLNIDFEILKTMIAEDFKSKEKLITLNHQALQSGKEYAEKNFKCPLPISVEKRDLVGKRIMLDGNTACALGAVYAGATVCGWYPITPSTSVIDSFIKFCNKYRVDPKTGKKNVAIVQTEDELAAIGVVIGGAWNGARSFTATSGPGLSLMNEFLGLAYYAEIPVVLVDVQRAGPSTGLPTRTQQADLMNAAYAAHGDSKNVLIFPSTPTECFELTAKAFDYAERLQNPVIVMTDIELGMNDWLTEPLKWDDSYTPDRGKVMSAEDLDKAKDWGRYLDLDGDGIPYRTIPGTHPSKGSFFTRGSGHDRYAAYSEDPAKYQDNVDRLKRKLKTAESIIPAPVIKNNNSKFGVIYYGTSAPPVEEASDLLSKEGHPVDLMRVRSFPFSDEVYDFISKHEKVYIVEQNRDAQLRSMLLIERNVNPEKLIPVLHYTGMPLTADFLHQEIGDLLERGSKVAAKS